MKVKCIHPCFSDVLIKTTGLRTWKVLMIIAVFFAFSSSDLNPDEGRLVVLRELPPVLAENSGMVEYEGLLWFVNDGGNEPVVYGYDLQQGFIVRQLHILETENTDWEEIAQDENHIYIGDFGNNSGSRKDLRIIILDKKDLRLSDDILPSGIIRFSYADQKDFTPSFQKTPYDGEALIVSGDSILIFTKDWVNQLTTVYSLPAEAGIYQAVPRQKFECRGLITAAAYLESSHQLIFLGYENYTPFLWIIGDFRMPEISFDKAARIDFVSSFTVQAEALAVAENGYIRISAEEAVFPPQLFQADF